MKVIKKRMIGSDALFDPPALLTIPVCPEASSKQFTDEILFIWVGNILEANLRQAACGEQDAIEWVGDECDDNALSFRNCCKLLGYDAARLSEKFLDHIRANLCKLPKVVEL